MEIIKNYLKYSLWFVLIVFAVLLGLHWLPALTIDGHTMRRVDLLSDLRYPESETAAADSDSIPLPPVVKPAFVDTCRTGMTCIEDYSDSTLRGMTPFYKALDRVSSDDSDDKQVRIAVFGDSFIEADIFTADLREMLQKQFGGCGVGFAALAGTFDVRVAQRIQSIHHLGLDRLAFHIRHRQLSIVIHGCIG